MAARVKVAPSVHLAFWQRTAKELALCYDPEKDRLKMQIAREEIALLSSANLSAGSGKFWASDSDSECEDLGDSELLASSSRASTATGALANRPQQPVF